MKNLGLLSYVNKWLIIFGALNLLLSCDDETLKGEFYLTEDQKKLIPYSENDTLKFQNEFSDTINYIVIEYFTEMERFFSGESDKSYNLLETKTCDLFNKFDSTVLHFVLNATSPSGYNYDLIFYKKIDNYTKKNIIMYPISSIINKTVSELDKDSLFFSTYEINGYKFQDVYKICAINAESNKGQKMKALYYNFYYGIIKIEFDNLGYWTVIKN